MPYSREQFVEDYYGALPRMAAIGQHFQGQRDSQQMAEMAAGRFEALGGDQAGYWANQIRQNPRAAIQLAEQYGGLGAIEQSLQSARAQSQADAALRDSMMGSADGGGAGMTAAQFEAFKRGGGAGLKAYNEAMGLGREHGFDADQAMKLRSRYEKQAGNFSTIRHFYEIAAANAAKAAENPTDPGAVDFALVQAYGKMLDPNSVVKNEEGQFIVQSQSSEIADKINRFARLFSASGTLNPQARLNLMRQIQATYEQAEESHKGVLGEMEAELDAIGAQGIARELALPIGLRPATRRMDLAPWELAVKGSTPPTVEDVAKMKSVTLPDGTRMVRGPDGAWSPAE